MRVYDKLEQSLKLLGIESNHDSFADRKRLQKITYLLEKGGVDLGFGFNWYLHGPYSPSLTRVLYKEDLDEMKRDVLEDKDDKKRILALKDSLGSDLKSSDTLELIASLHYIITLGKLQNKSDEEIYQLFRELKPFFSEDDTKYYFKRVNSLIKQGVLSQ